ncbi:MAG TPA: MazG nucleotide pyrophosphohydrolase domain-containing protein [Candidatus Brocadiia bacterium]|nr:MazG nucleotide pyrophosphohydrolase domain-containing protein [Candidatus Brocadiia bacterium]
MHINEFQRAIEKMYFTRDNARGMGGTFMWFVEEVGELATALRNGDKQEMLGEFADVLAWLVTLASMSGIDMEEAVRKYENGCPACHATPCRCSQKV